MEFLIKLLELSEKHVAAAFLTILCILVLPEKIAASTPLFSFRNSYESWLWLLLLFFGFLCCIQLHPKISKYLIFPVKKLFFPREDFVTGIKQSRFRMQEARLVGDTESGEVYYRGTCSNGLRLRYYNSKRLRVPLEEHEIHLIGKGFARVNCPPIDWQDVFNGDNRSGTWGITHDS